MAKPSFPFDENIPRELGTIATSEGFDGAFLVDLAKGSPDENVLALALQEERVVVTEDMDFGRLAQIANPCRAFQMPL